MKSGRIKERSAKGVTAEAARQLSCFVAGSALNKCGTVTSISCEELLEMLMRFLI